MAAQNIPGMAVLASFGYRPRLRGPLLGTGRRDRHRRTVRRPRRQPRRDHRRPRRRPRRASGPRPPLARLGRGRRRYVALGLGAGVITAFAALSPPLLLEAVAGLALLRTLGGALADALADPGRREAAVITFVVAASGITIAGIGAPFWALVAGIAVAARRRRPAAAALAAARARDAQD